MRSYIFCPKYAIFGACQRRFEAQNGSFQPRAANASTICFLRAEPRGGLHRHAFSRETRAGQARNPNKIKHGILNLHLKLLGIIPGCYKKLFDISIFIHCMQEVPFKIDDRAITSVEVDPAITLAHSCRYLEGGRG